ncbi:MAG: hypothetical protein QOH63_615 [Acidobacteriota bacterium]|jgi:uncharacterized damage-inducible protein DinB|nr:hypothetical protein [Acidobacteriota bacterium]
MKLIEPMIAELQHEATSTRKMLERVPQESLSWQPHEKSMTLGRLASHIAMLPGLFIAKLNQDELDRSELKPPPADSVAAILETFDQNIAGSFEVLKTQSEERLLASWRYRDGEKIIFEMPRVAVFRLIALNHLIHHRGQLSVYLRLLNVPLPSVYGPTADETL